MPIHETCRALNNKPEHLELLKARGHASRSVRTRVVYAESMFDAKSSEHLLSNVARARTLEIFGRLGTP